MFLKLAPLESLNVEWLFNSPTQTPVLCQIERATLKIHNNIVEDEPQGEPTHPSPNYPAIKQPQGIIKKLLTLKKRIHAVLDPQQAIFR